MHEPLSVPERLKGWTMAWIVFTHAGALLAPFYFTWPAFFTFLTLYWVTSGLGITLAYHRLLTHRSFKVPKALEYLFTVFACLALQGGPISWVATHRIHHAYSDRKGDPHSPLDGFFWAHSLWCMSYMKAIDEYDQYVRYTPDLARDSGHCFLDRAHGYLSLAAAVLLYALGGMPFLVWGFFVRLVVSYHATWFVNSASHVWGYRNFDCKDRSKNNWWVALLSFGEGWHNNHHAFQQSARHGMRWWELDLTYLTIRLLSGLGLAWDVQVPDWKPALCV